MDKGINIRSVLLLKKAVEILDYLGTKYDIEKLRKRPDICKEIINKFKDLSTLPLSINNMYHLQIEQ